MVARCKDGGDGGGYRAAAVVAARGARLQTKLQPRRSRVGRTDDIARLLPPGAAAMKEKVRRPSFVDGVEGDKAWAAGIPTWICS